MQIFLYNAAKWQYYTSVTTIVTSFKFNNRKTKTMKTISPEHKALAASLVDKLQNMELHTVKDTYEATRDAVNELGNVMYRHYHVDALPAIAALFDELLDAVNGVCGNVGAIFLLQLLDEDGDFSGNKEVGTWDDATFALLATSRVNLSPSPSFTWAETFAAEIASHIECCILDWKCSKKSTDFDREYDRESQNFLYWK